MFASETMHPLTQIEIMHRLKKVGFTQEQAETQAEITTQLHESNLATKQDFKDFKQEAKQGELNLEKRLERLEIKLENEVALVRKDIEVLKGDLSIRMAVIMSTLLALFSAIQKILGN